MPQFDADSTDTSNLNLDFGFDVEKPDMPECDSDDEECEKPDMPECDPEVEECEKPKPAKKERDGEDMPKCDPEVEECEKPDMPECDPDVEVCEKPKKKGGKGNREAEDSTEDA